jgi:phage terminase large subunit
MSIFDQKFRFHRNFKECFKPSRYKILYGGRGGGKSFFVADYMLFKALASPIRVLCAREIQNTIRDSVHLLLRDRIAFWKLESFFEVTREEIRSNTGSVFLFKGIRHNVQEIKSMQGINYCWVEEAQKVTKDSMEILIPTIREEGSEIWLTFNPDRPDDYVYQNFVENPPSDAVTVKVNYTDNPHCPEVIKLDAQELRARDYDAYRKVYLGEPIINSEALIFKDKYEVREFDTPDNATFYHGADWGDVDPTAFVRCWMKGNCLYIDYTSGGSKLELDQKIEELDKIPTARAWEVLADNAWPDTIKFFKRNGFNILGDGKLKVEEGIQFLKNFDKIIVHPRCEHIIGEFGKYSYIQDKHSGAILPKIEDKNNHWIDALRYALKKVIQMKQKAGVPSIPLNVAW